jgi:glycosyltransferase involved in cell wall biosynthesis
LYQKGEITKDGSVFGAKGGTELMKEKIESLSKELLDDFQIIHSRVRDIDPNRIPILVLHDLAEDPEVRHLAEASFRGRFAKLVFVSNWQFTSYQKVLGIPYDCSKVLLNAIEPIEPHVKNTDGPIRLIYHTTPHRGLQLLYPVYDLLSKKYGDKLHLDVYSSFKIYGWEQRDEQYKDLFEALKAHPHITYHGSVSNTEIREALKKAHIFAYPCIWPETSCIAAIEALSARCLVVCPSYAALPETTGRFALEYDFTSNVDEMMTDFIHRLTWAIENLQTNLVQTNLYEQKLYTDFKYNWTGRAVEWEQMLQTIRRKWKS